MDRLFAPIQLQNQEGGGPLGNGDVEEAGDFGERRLVEKLHGRGENPGAENLHRRLYRLLDGGEAQPDHPSGFRERDQLQRDLRDQGQGSFRPHEEGCQVVPDDVLESPGPCPENLPGREDGGEPEHVVLRDAVLETAGAAGVLRDVSSQSGVLEGGRIGRVEEVLPLYGPLELFGYDSGLDPGQGVGGRDFKPCPSS